MCGSRGETGGPDTPGKFQKNIGFLSNTGAGPLKVTKLPIQNSMLDHHRPANSGIWILPKKKTLSKFFGPPLTKLSGSAHVNLDNCVASHNTYYMCC